MSILLFIGGLVAVLAGAQALVVGASRLAASFGISPIVIGLTVVGFGTSAPEMVVSALASFEGEPETALGNVLGSNIVNVGLVLGVSAAIYPLRPDRSVLRREGPVMIFASIGVTLVALNGVIERPFGILMLLAMAVFLVMSLRGSRQDSAEIAREVEEFEETTHLLGPGSRLLEMGLVLAGLVLLVGGGHSLVTGAVDIAESAGIPEFVIASTMVAIGTSVPELATSIIAAFKREADIAVGNVIGSNLFNLLVVLGLAVLIQPVDVSDTIKLVDLPLMTAFAIGAIVIARTGWRIGRLEGWLLMLCYAGYLALLLLR